MLYGGLCVWGSGSGYDSGCGLVVFGVVFGGVLAVSMRGEFAWVW